jgi:hypothetical protein
LKNVGQPGEKVKNSSHRSEVKWASDATDLLEIRAVRYFADIPNKRVSATRYNDDTDAIA